MLSYIFACSDPFYLISEESQLDQIEQLFFCQTCKLHCPLRASHCHDCNKCVLRRDHHCPFLGKCVGMGNHLYFIIFLFFIIIFDSYSLFVFSNSMKDDQKIEVWLITSLPCSLSFFISILSIFQPIILLPTHLYYAFSNITTWELSRSKRITYLSNWIYRISPFSHGLLNNFWEFIIMRWSKPLYYIPITEDEIFMWKEDNSCVSNDNYECC